MNQPITFEIINIISIKKSDKYPKSPRILCINGFFVFPRANIITYSAPFSMRISLQAISELPVVDTSSRRIIVIPLTEISSDAVIDFRWIILRLSPPLASFGISIVLLRKCVLSILFFSADNFSASSVIPVSMFSGLLEGTVQIATFSGNKSLRV